MTTRSRVCPACGALNGPDEKRCFRCGGALRGLGRLWNEAFARPFVASGFIVGLCALDFALMTLLGDAGRISILGGGIQLGPFVQVGGIVGDLLEDEPFRYLTAVYVHLGVLHLGMNMLALIQLGRPLEKYLGAARYLVLYTTTGVVGFVASRLWYGPISPMTAGASGALFGLLGFQIGMLHARRDPRTRGLVLQQLAYAAAFALLFPVNNAAHLGGALAGFAFGWALHFEKRPARLESTFRLLAALCLAATLASLALAARSPIVAEARAVDRMRED